MRNAIRPYIGLTKEEKNKLWDNATFVFDTNVYLDLYRYSKKTRDALLDAMNKMNTRIWMPYQVAEEYARHRPKTIFDCKERYSKIENSFMENLKKELRLKKDDSDLSKIQAMVHQWIEEYAARNTLIDSPFDDEILNELLTLYDNKVGLPYDESKMTEIKKSGAERYNKKTPPGYMDQKKKDNDGNDNNAFGDYIIWKQIMDYAKSSEKDIVFITNDNKEDWWLIISGKTIGPRFELIKEFDQETHRKFHMYNMEHFISLFKEKEESRLDESVIDEVKAYADDPVGPKSTERETNDIQGYLQIVNGMQPWEIEEYIADISKQCIELQEKIDRRKEDLNGIYRKYGHTNLSPKVAKMVIGLRKNIFADSEKLRQLNNHRNMLVHSGGYLIN